MNESLSGEAGKKPLHGPLLKMQLNNFICHDAGVFKDHRSNGRCPAPLPELLIAWARYPEAVHGFCPRGVGTFALVHRREDAPATVGITRGCLQRLCTENLQGAGNGGSEVILRERNRLL